MNSDPYILEVCVENLRSALNAEVGGADRIELCQALEIGGLTPSIGLVKILKAKLSIPIFMLIRPRSGDFFYNELEVNQMLEDIKAGVSVGVDGFVTGALLRNSKVDKAACSLLMNAANGLPVTFHRAFDYTNDDEALEDIIELGFNRILTSGRAETALDGIDIIQHLIDKANSRILIMPGSGVSEKTLTNLLTCTKATEFHSSAQQNPYSSCTLNSVVKGASSYPLTSDSVVKRMKEIFINFRDCRI